MKGNNQAYKLWLCLLCSFLLLPLEIQAQEKGDSITGKVHKIDEVTVTARRPLAKVTTGSPVQLINKEDIKNLGLQNMADAVRRFATHPMFGPTFANLDKLSTENAIIISEGDHLGKIFFKDLYQNLGLNIFEYTFEEHDETVAYSLSIPFVSTFVFAAVMKHQDAPGTTFKRHMKIAKGVLNEDDYLLQEILFNPRTPAQVEGIRTELNELLDIINKKDAAGMRAYLSKIREKIK